MRVAGINQAYNLKQNNTQAFKGLWGKTSMINDIEPAMCIFKNQTTYYYYPFLDETDEEINKVVKENSSAYIDEKSRRYKVNECRVCVTLPCTKSAYEEYTKADASTKLTEYLKDIHMGVNNKYINNALNHQISAVNDKIKYELYQNA